MLLAGRLARRQSTPDMSHRSVTGLLPRLLLVQPSAPTTRARSTRHSRRHGRKRRYACILPGRGASPRSWSATTHPSTAVGSIPERLLPMSHYRVTDARPQSNWRCLSSSALTGACLAATAYGGRWAPGNVNVPTMASRSIGASAPPTHGPSCQDSTLGNHRDGPLGPCARSPRTPCRLPGVRRLIVAGGSIPDARESAAPYRGHAMLQGPGPSA